MNVIGLKNTGKVIAYYNPVLTKPSKYSFYELTRGRYDDNYVTPVNFNSIIFGQDYNYNFQNFDNQISISPSIAPYENIKGFSFRFKYTDNSNNGLYSSCCILQIPGCITLNLSPNNDNKLGLLTTSMKKISTLSLSKNTYYNVYVDFENGYFYINGINYTTTFKPSWTLDSGDSIKIGRGNYSGYFSLRMSLCEFAFYNAVLTNDERNILFSNATYVTGVKINEQIDSKLKIKDTFQLTTTVYPTDTTIKTVLWTSSDDSVATVDYNGLVTCVGEGTCTITATTTEGTGIKDSRTINVSSISKIIKSTVKNAIQNHRLIQEYLIRQEE